MRPDIKIFTSAVEDFDDITSSFERLTAAVLLTCTSSGLSRGTLTRLSCADTVAA